jgi:flagellin-like hook-associated protein FlgL
MSDITLSSAVRSNLLSLQNTADLMSKTQERLATGLKVNSALDNPTNFFTASALNSRASDLGRLLDGVSNATQTLEAADNGIEAITKLVESAQATARQALQTPGTVETAALVNGSALANDTAATTTGTATITADSAAVLTGTVAFPGSVTAGDEDAGTTLSGVGDNESFTVTVDDGSGPTAVTFELDTAGDGGSGAGGVTVIDISGAETIADIGTAVQTAVRTATSGTETVGFDGSGNFTITADDNTTTIAVSGTAAGDLFGTTTSADPTNAQIGALTGSITVGSETLTFGSGNIETRADLETALGALTGVTASVDGSNNVTFQANNTTDDIVIGGDAGNLTALGLTAGTTTATNAALAASSDSFTVQFGSAAASTIDLSSINSVEQLTTALSSVAGVTYDATDGRVEVEASNTDDSIVIAGAGAAAAGLTAGTTAPTSTVNTERGEFVTQYNELMGQIDELAEDSGFNGVNLLDGDDLSVIFNEDGSSTLSITGVSFDATGLGLSELASTGLDTDASINSTLDTLDTAISSLRSQASEFGSNLSIVETRENFTKSMINTLETGAANLTLADTNEEGANLLALQTRQQLSSTALSLASQADQNVLRLF